MRTINKEIKQLKEDLIQEHPDCELNFEMSPRKPSRPVEQDTKETIDAFARSLKLRELGDRWFEVDKHIAQEILVEILSESFLHYETIHTPKEIAVKNAERFIGLFEEPVRFFTSARYSVNDKRMIDFYFFTEATFDLCVIGMSSDWLGIIWVEEED